MEAAGENRAEGWFQMMRAIKAVGGRIIDFLDQIEDFQKMLLEKRKFITETQYCITVGNIAEDFYPEIAANEPNGTSGRTCSTSTKKRPTCSTRARARRTSASPF